MLLELKFSVGTLGLAMGTFLAGIYGMNLHNYMETAKWGFGTVTTASVFFSLIVCWYGLVKLRKVQRIKMGGHSECLPETGRERRLQNGNADAILDPTNRERLRRINMMKTLAAKQRPQKWF